jgi:uncharacterized membrane protein (UPF0127 family)
MMMFRFVLLMLLGTAALGALPQNSIFALRPAFAQGQSAPVTLPSTPLAIQTSDGNTHRFKVEVARSPDERSLGLMFRRTLAPDAGMLFDFGHSEPVAMWMKNTLIPLDMLFIGSDGTVVNIAQRTVPQSLTPIPAAKPVRFVLEVPGGTASRLGIKPLFGTGEP